MERVSASTHPYNELESTTLRLIPYDSHDSAIHFMMDQFSRVSDSDTPGAREWIARATLGYALTLRYRAFFDRPQGTGSYRFLRRAH